METIARYRGATPGLTARRFELSGLGGEDPK